MPLKRKRRSTRFKKPLDENKNEPSTPSDESSPQNEVVEQNKLNEINNVTTAKQATEDVQEKLPITSQKNDTSYPCRYCNETFPEEAICKTHIKICLNKAELEANNELDLNKSSESNIYKPQITQSVIQSNNPEKHNDEYKKPIIAPNGSTFYPCQHCSKIFPRETTCKTHMEKCSNKKRLEIATINDKNTFTCQYCNKLFSTEVEYISHEEICLKKPKLNHSENNIPQNLNSSGSSVENLDPEKQFPFDSFSENVDDPVPKKIKPDISIYDYDEEDSVDNSSIVNADVKCKVCPFIAESPIDLLKHKREVHKVARKILPPHEIQKYFDYPDRNVCPICEQPIKSRNFRSIFVKHLLVHTAGLTYECRICKKKFRRLDHMRAHEKRHILTYSEFQAIQDSVDNTPVELPLDVSN